MWRVKHPNAEFQPAIYSGLEDLAARALLSAGRRRTRSLRSRRRSFDSGVLEPIAAVFGRRQRRRGTAAVRCDVRWQAPKVRERNHRRQPRDTDDCVIRSTDDHLVATIGLNFVSSTDDAMLIAPGRRSRLKACGRLQQNAASSPQSRVLPSHCRRGRLAATAGARLARARPTCRTSIWDAPLEPTCGERQDERYSGKGRICVRDGFGLPVHERRLRRPRWAFAHGPRRYEAARLIYRRRLTAFRRDHLQPPCRA